MTNTLPIFLEGYDPFSALEEWKAGAVPTCNVRLHWSVDSTPLASRAKGSAVFQCHLSWSLNGQCAALDRFALTVAEAVWLVLEEYRRMYRPIRG